MPPGTRRSLGEDFAHVLDGARAGEAWAWTRLYEALAPAVAGYLRVQGARDVDDLVSEVWLGVFRAIARFEGDESQFRSWVFVIAHNRLIDERRRTGRRPEDLVEDDSLERLAPVAEDPTAESARLAREHVESLCAKLSPDQRDAVLLRVVGDLPNAEIAAALGKNEGAVRVLLHRGLGRLRELLAEEDAAGGVTP
ncbi:MAG: RNA polymerase sigma factor [Actinobacteria bacterium]|nr:RNA polymerase sigma factor [Actinomycetota bacterium]